MTIGKAEYDRISERIIGCAFTVANTLGVGFAEKVYENALTLEMRKRGLTVEQQYAMTVRYDDTIVGEFTADLLVESRVIVELKVVKTLIDPHFAQCLNYVRAGNKPLCLLINFGRAKIEIRRIVHKF